jgi:hypothetical protein
MMPLFMSYNLQSHKPAPGCTNDTYKRAAQVTLSSEIVQQLLRLEVEDDTTVRHTYEASP